MLYMLESYRLYYPVLGIVRTATRCHLLIVFLPRTRALVSSFLIRRSFSPLIFALTVLRSLVPGDSRVTRYLVHGPAHGDLRFGNFAGEETGRVLGTTWYIIRSNTSGLSLFLPMNSPVWRVVGQVLPGCKLAPGAHI